jgi:two-component system, LuxR family, response regulator FixJ
LAQEGGPDEPSLCVILDLNMPGLNGLELQEALAERGRAEQVIFITGGASAAFH